MADFIPLEWITVSKLNQCDAVAARIQTPMVSLTFKKFDNLVRKLLWISCSNCHEYVKTSINIYLKKYFNKAFILRETFLNPTRPILG